MHSKESLICGAYNRGSVYLMYRTFNLAKISLESNDAGEEQWVVEPNWQGWEAAGRPDMPGITVEEKYRYNKLYRDDMPYVVSCVCPTAKRAMKGNRAELRQYGMFWYDPIEYLIRSRGVGSVCGEYYFSKAPTDYLDVRTITREWIMANYESYSKGDCNGK